MSGRRVRRYFSQLSELERGLIIGRKPQAVRHAILLARSIVRSVPSEYIESSGHKMGPICGVLGLE